MTTADIVATAAGELYGAPLDEFTARRDGLARSLRAAGDKEAADAVKKLAKPSIAAWTVNQLAREREDEMAELIEAGAELRRVQEWLLRREADPHDLRRAVEAERAVVGRLAAAASELLQAAGRPGGPSLLERIAETLHAAASDPELADRARSGLLVREEVAVGVGVTGLRLPPSLEARASQGAGQKETEKEREKEKEAERRSAITRAEVRARTAAEHEREAQRAVGRAQGSLVSAEQELNRAQHALQDARERLAAAEATAGEARAEAEAATAELDELRGGG